MKLFQNQLPQKRNVDLFFLGGASKKPHIRLNPIVTDHQEVFFLRTFIQIYNLRSQMLLIFNLITVYKVPGPTF